MLETNKQLGRYILRSRLGSGGMGEVYVAHDPKIGRDVAVKVLPADHLQDRDRLARFEQEAQAAGSLNHPNIVAVYDVDMNEGIPYVVSELLEGETLRSAVGTVPLPIRKAMDYAMQIAHGLAAAHERGIIHRDLKPENIFITSDGRVKILDFGLAKLVQPDSPSEETFSDESTKQVSTDPGTVMGTMGYMSPEQLRGQPIDARTDIFSFGSVFYEMLTGKRAFHRESTADTISAILREELPDLSESNKNVRPGLDKLVHRCLAKNKEQRFHSASDLAFALDAISNAEPSGEFRTAMPAPLYAKPANNLAAKLRVWAGWAAAAALLVATVVFAALYFGRREEPAQVMRFALPAPEQVTFGDSIALSPDGEQVAFTAVGGSGGSSLWIRSVDAMEARQLPGTAGAAFPFWSPDSRYIAFYALGKLKKIEPSGGTAQVITDVSTDVRGGSWSKDDVILFSPDITSGLFKISASGGKPVQVTSLNAERGETSHRWPSFLPDGDHFLFYNRGNRQDLGGVFVGSLTSKETKLVLANELTAIYAPPAKGGPGHLLYVRAGSLIAQPFDTTKLELSGEAVTLAEDVVNFPTEVGPSAYGVFSASANGHLLYRTGGDQPTKLAWFDRGGKELSMVTPPGVYHEPRLSPDGKKIAFARGDGRSENLQVLDIAAGTISRLTFGSSRDVSAVWSPDGATIVFASTRDAGVLKLFAKSATGAGSEELLLDSPRNAMPDDWTKDGAFLVYSYDTGPSNRNDLMLLPVAGERKPVPYLQTQFTESHARFSPDGRFVAYTSDESGRFEIYVQTHPLGGGTWQISTDGGDHAQWSSDGRTLYFMADRNLMAVPINPGTVFEAGKPVPLFETKIPLTSLTDHGSDFLVSEDGRRFLINSLVDERNTKPLTLVLNWQAGIRR